MSGLKTVSMAEVTEEHDVGEGSDGSHESINLRPGSGRPDSKPQFPENMQQHTRSSYLRRWRHESSSEIQLASPPETPMSLQPPGTNWLPEGNRGSIPMSVHSRSESPAYRGRDSSVMGSDPSFVGRDSPAFGSTPMVCPSFPDV